jgi:predicted dehydrogenase
MVEAIFENRTSCERDYNMELNRRSFALRIGAGAASGRILGANERIRLGVIGCGGRGRELIRILRQFSDCDIPAVSDVIESRMQEAQALLADGTRPQATETILDYRRILERKDIDAIVIATTQHWHGIPFLHAVQAKKPIYIEQPPHEFCL